LVASMLKKTIQNIMSGKESFLLWICTETGIPDFDISQKLGQIFENIFDEIVDEYGYLSEEELDEEFNVCTCLGPLSACGAASGGSPP